VGPVAVLPAAFAFSVRYGLPMSAFGAATEPNIWYSRLTRAASMGLKAHELPFTNKRLDETTVGGRRTKRGRVAEPGKTVRVVFTAEWPVLTHVLVEGEPAGACRAHVAQGGFFRDVSYGEAPFVKGTATLKVPPGAFGNGINEFKIRVLGDNCKGALLRRIVLDDRNDYQPPFDNQKRWVDPQAKRRDRAKNKD
jgi:hypothetical protein